MILFLFCLHDIFLLMYRFLYLIFLGNYYILISNQNLLNIQIVRSRVLRLILYQQTENYFLRQHF